MMFTAINRLHSDFIYFIFYNNDITNKCFKLFTSLECKYNKLQFGLRISSIEASKQKLLISTAFYAYNKTSARNLSRSDSFKSKRIKSVSQ